MATTIPFSSNVIRAIRRTIARLSALLKYFGYLMQLDGIFPFCSVLRDIIRRMLQQLLRLSPYPKEIAGEEGTEADDTAEDEAEKHDDKSQYQGDDKLQGGTMIGAKLFTIGKEESWQQKKMKQIDI